MDGGRREVNANHVHGTCSGFGFPGKIVSDEVVDANAGGQCSRSVLYEGSD